VLEFVTVSRLPIVYRRQIVKANCMIALDTVDNTMLYGARVRTRFTSAPVLLDQHNIQQGGRVDELYSCGERHRHLLIVSNFLCRCVLDKDLTSEGYDNRQQANTEGYTGVRPTAHTSDKRLKNEVSGATLGEGG